MFMASFYEDLEKLKTYAGRAGLLGGIFRALGIVFALLRVIGEAANVKIGLEQTSWYLLAIVASVLSVSLWISWAVSLYLKSTEAKK
jgi:hypothetical protein